MEKLLATCLVNSLVNFRVGSLFKKCLGSLIDLIPSYSIFYLNHYVLVKAMMRAAN